jgi:hypothetical protein
MAAFVQKHVWRILALSALVTAPCFWHPRIEAGDLGSHVYNAWLAQLVEGGQAPGVYLVRQWNNVLFDLALSWTGKWMGLPAAEKLVVPVCVLIFFWGAFALISATPRTPAWYLTPAIAMIAYGWTFHSGFLNYYVSLGFAFLGAAMFWRGKGWERLWAAIWVPLIVLAHPVGLIWLVGTAAYIELSKRIPGWRRILLLPAAALALAGVRIYLPLRGKVVYNQTHFYWFNGADQLWLFGNRYAVIAVVAFLTVAAFFLYDAIRRRRAGLGWMTYRIPLELYAISILAVALLPNRVQFPEDPIAFSSIIPRLTSIVAVLGLCVLSCVELKKWHLGGLTAVAAVFFVFLYQDTGLLNRAEQHVGVLIKDVPPGGRVIYTLAAPKGSRASFFVHLVDRACIGRCFTFANYEPSSGMFRVRAREGNRVVIHDPVPRCEMEKGFYVVQPADLPIYQIYQPIEDPQGLRIRELKAGEENGRIGLRSTTNPCRLPGS